MAATGQGDQLEHAKSSGKPAMSINDRGRLDRRRFNTVMLGTLATISTGIAHGGGGADSPAPARRIIDVHSHFVPPELKAATKPAPPLLAWNLSQHLENMDAAGVQRAILSITTPGVAIEGAAGQTLLRKCNDYGANLVAGHPQRFGHFVHLKLDDPGNALAELAYGLDQLKAQGVGVFTNYHEKWLGDPAFDPVFAELERRRALVYVHPIAASCCSGIIPEFSDAMIEYQSDTTRAIASYIYRGAARRFPNVKMIWSHAGGTMPYLIERFDVADRAQLYKDSAPQGFRAAAAKFYYDIAQTSNAVTTGALRQVIPVDHIVFGTDYPFRTPSEHVAQLESSKVFSPTELAQLYRGNVMRDLPTLG
jgi:6-methylsalicylate decarboxylase